jgi:predicted nucleotidyltransferase
MSDWVIPTKRKRTNRKTSREKLEVNLSTIKQYFPDIIEKYKPRAVFLYGSMARGKQRPDSDIDLMFIWNREIPPNSVEILKEISSFFSKKVDMVNMIYVGKPVDIVNDNEYFLSNVYQDAIMLFGRGDQFDIKLSALIGKVKVH